MSKNIAPKILCVDDDPNILTLVFSVLSQAGFETITAATGREAQEQLCRQHNISAVLLDIFLPDIDGLELINDFRLAHPYVPVLAITGYEDVSLAVNVMKAGAFDFLPKPLIADQLVAAINRAIEYKSQMEGRRQREFLHARLATLGELTAGINREIASALDSINNGLRQIDQIHLPAITREYLDLARGGVERIHQLLKNSKGLCCSDKGIETFDLKALVEDCCVTLRHEFKNKEIELSVTIAPQITIEGVRSQIEQTILNILLNASHAVGAGGQISLSALQEKGNVIIRIADNGTGIPREALPNIFRPFYSTKEFGTGLGLAYCKGIVENHGGKISVQSTLGKGATFTVTLPTPTK